MLEGVSIITAILGFAFVIFIHELGHFLFAKWADVKVERFSIGMGPIIWSRTIGETEYALSILPVGGYVKMLGQEDLPGQHVESKDERSFTNKHPGWRAAILFGGVLFNIVSSYIILLILAWYGLPVFSPQVGMVKQYATNAADQRVETPAWQHDLRIGDQILSVNGKKVRSYTDLMMYSLAASTEPITLEILRQDGTTLTEELNSVYDKERGSHTLGIEMPIGLRVANVVTASGAESDLRINDRIVGIVGNDEDYDALRLVGYQLYNRLASHVQEEIQIKVERDGEIIEVPFTYAGYSIYDLVGPNFGTLIYTLSVLEGSPAEKAGILPGDYIAKANNKRILNGPHINGLVNEAARNNQSITFDIYRHDGSAYKPMQLTMKTYEDPHTGMSIIGIARSHELAGPIIQVEQDQTFPALAEAGIEPGHIILRWDLDERENHVYKSVNALVAQKGTIQIIPYTKDAEKKMHRRHIPGFWPRLFGVKPAKTTWERLSKSRIKEVATEKNSRLLVDQIDGTDASKSEMFEVDLIKFTTEERKVFYQLQVGDYIIDRDAVAADGSPAFMVLRGAAPTDLTWKKVELQDAGALVALMMEERPYQLESWTEGFTVANDMCAQIIGTTINIIPRFFKAPEQGGIEASKSLAGPIGIFAGMKQKTEYFGFASFLKLLAFIGINLFLVNLLPIPIVDGGQLVFLAIEVVIRRPVPLVVVEVANWMGLILIVGLMIFILGIDIDRHFLS